jgi:hypothetical protein
VLRALARWPNTPAVYGWLALDARGNWRLRNPAHSGFELIGNLALREFIGRNYLHDERGCWYFQNGPQRAYVRLARAPFVFRLFGDDLVDHCGERAGAAPELWIDPQASVVLRAPRGVGVLDDRDLLSFSERLIDVDGEALGERLAGVLAPSPGVAAEAFLPTRYGRLPLARLASDDLGSHFGFVLDPVA